MANLPLGRQIKREGTVLGKFKVGFFKEITAAENNYENSGGRGAVHPSGARVGGKQEKGS